MKISLSRLKEICSNGNYTYIVGTDNFYGLDLFTNDLIIHQKYDKVVVIFNPNIVYFVSDNGCIGIQHINEIDYKRSLDDSGEISIVCGNKNKRKYVILIDKKY